MRISLQIFESAKGSSRVSVLLCVDAKESGKDVSGEKTETG